MSDYHTPVLIKETLEYLNIRTGKWYIDATLGGGGHTEEILKKGGQVIGIDQDQEAIQEVAQKHNLEVIKVEDHLEAHSKNLILIQSNFTDLKNIISKFRHPERSEGSADESLKPRDSSSSPQNDKQNSNSPILRFSDPPISGVLFDLGVSSHQLDEGTRGFSFGKDAFLDMRMNQSFGATAADLVNGLHSGELEEVFLKLGEEKYAKRIANKITEARKTKKIETTAELAELVKFALPRTKEKIHPATRVFQALRIAVNDELNSIKVALPQALEILEPGGRIVVISFHSLEDRIIKTTFKEFAEKAQAQILTPKPIEPSLDDQYDNPRSRSAKLRAIEKL